MERSAPCEVAEGQQAAEGPPAPAGVPLPCPGWQIRQGGGGLLLRQRWGTAVLRYHKRRSERWKMCLCLILKKNYGDTLKTNTALIAKIVMAIL